MKKLTIQEEEAMKAVWKKRKGFIKDFLELYPEPKPQYTTLASTIKKLEAKGYVEGKKFGPIYEYRPVISESEYTKTFMSGFVKDYFKSSYRDLVISFVKQKKLSPNELRSIINLIETKHHPS